VDKEKIKILVLVPVYERLEILKYCMDRLTYPAWIKLEVLFVNSFMGLPSIVNLKFWWIQRNNKPLGNKMNEGMTSSFSHILNKWAYLMNLGSDDILSNDYWDKVRPHLENKEDIIGMNQIVIYEPSTSRAKILKLNDSHSCNIWGGGRLISRRAIEKTIEEKGHIYEPILNSGLDTSSQNNIMEATGAEPAVIDGHYLLDIKTEENINTFDSLADIPSEAITIEEMESKYGKIEI